MQLYWSQFRALLKYFFDQIIQQNQNFNTFVKKYKLLKLNSIIIQASPSDLSGSMHKFNLMCL